MDRNLRSCIYKSGVSLAVEMQLVPTTIQIRKPKVMVKEIYWPCLSMYSWLEVLVESYPQIVFAGFQLEQETQWRELMCWFWKSFKEYDPTHPVYDLQRDGTDLSLAIPIMTHGDEGRGLHSQAFMVESFQFVLSHLGPFTTNTSGQLGCHTDRFDLNNKEETCSTTIFFNQFGLIDYSPITARQPKKKH